MKVHHFKNLPIAEQLKLEEELLRSSTEEHCIINEGTPPTIVMGISGKMEELVRPGATLPLLKRFSGGGTVVVDEETIFITFICNRKPHDFPESIMRWTGEFYQRAAPPITLRENDYVIGEKKCGGNAQYIKKERWLHHTSFLWDYSEERMDLLLHPKKTPQYRNGRSHSDFLSKLSDFFPSKDHFIQLIKCYLENILVLK